MTEPLSPSPASINDLHARFEEAFSAGAHEVHFVRDAAVQARHPPKLSSLRDDIRALKLAAIRTGNEPAANFLLGMQAMTDALLAEFEMVHLLKTNQPHEAWCALVTAQDNVQLALRTPFATGPGTIQYRERLDSVACAFFPTPTFLSAGFIHRGGTCTICGEAFDACPHLEGAIYCGRVCAEADFTSVELEHAAIVDHPRDRRCYVRNFQEGSGSKIDIMTRADIPEDEANAPSSKEGSAPGNGMRTEVVLFHNKLPVGVVP